MKTFVLAAAAAVAVSSFAAAEECDPIKTLVPMFEDLIQDATTCGEKTEYPFVPPSRYPTTEENAAICAKCADLVTKAKAKTFPSCTLEIGGAPTPLNTFFAKVVGACSASGSNGTATNNSTTTAPAVGVPSPTTVAPSPATVAPSPTTVAPTPAPTSSASMLASLSAAAVVAVATVASYAM